MTMPVTGRPTTLLLGGLAVMALASTSACSSSTNNKVANATSKAAALASSAAASAEAGMSAHPSPTTTALQHDVTLGAYCTPVGASGVNKSGLAVVCQKDSSGKDRWASAVTNPANVKAGVFCATNGQTATSGQQTKLVCTASSDGRLRWTVVRSG